MSLMWLGKLVFLVLILCSWGTLTSAQWINQSVALKVGWNAVFLTEEPYPPRCEDQFSGLPIDSVWTHDKQFTTVQYITNPNQLAPNLPEWRHYFPPGKPESVATNLHRLSAGQGYLIKATQDATWTFKSRPVLTRQEWNQNAYNLTGFTVNPASPPTFSTWFATSTAHLPLDIWSFGQDEQWHKITDPANTRIEPGKPYWVYCNGTSEFQGPVRIDIETGRTLDFDKILAEQEIQFIHESRQARTLTLTLQASQAPPSSVPDTPIPPLGGSVPLYYFDNGVVTNATPTYQYKAFPAVINFAGNETFSRRLGLEVRRREMAAASAEALFQSILVVNDNAGYLRRVAVTSLGPAAVAEGAQFKTLVNAVDVNAGLWTGFVTLFEVSDPGTGHPLRNTPAEFDFRFILHVDANGIVRMLNEATLLWRNGTFKQDPDTGDQVPDEYGRTVLMTASPPQALLNDITAGKVVGSSLRDGRHFAQRISTAMYSLRDANGKPETPPMNQTGGFGVNGGTLDIDLVLEDTDPLNPFHHQFHPLHKYPPGQPLPDYDYTIQRKVKLTFSDNLPDGLVMAGAGDAFVGGFYEETIQGLRRDPIKTRGMFRLNRATTVPVLNDGL